MQTDVRKTIGQFGWGKESNSCSYRFPHRDRLCQSTQCQYLTNTLSLFIIIYPSSKHLARKKKWHHLHFVFFFFQSDSLSDHREEEAASVLNKTWICTYTLASTKCSKQACQNYLGWPWRQGMSAEGSSKLQCSYLCHSAPQVLQPFSLSKQGLVPR